MIYVVSGLQELADKIAERAQQVQQTADIARARHVRERWQTAADELKAVVRMVRSTRIDGGGTAAYIEPPAHDPDAVYVGAQPSDGGADDPR